MKKILSTLTLTSLFVVLFLPVAVGAADPQPQCPYSCGQAAQQAGGLCYCGTAKFEFGGVNGGNYCLYISGKMSAPSIYTKQDTCLEARQNFLATTPSGATPGATPGEEAPTVVTGPQELIGLIEKIGNWIFAALMAIASVFLIYAAFKWVTGGGNPEEVNKARQLMINALIGVAIALLARGMVMVIRGILGG